MVSMFYTVQELAKMLQVSTKTISRMIARGELVEGKDFYRIGRSVRFYTDAMKERYNFASLSDRDINALAEAVADGVMDKVKNVIVQETELIQREKTNTHKGRA